MDEKQKNALDNLEEISKTFQEVFDEIEKEQEEYWNSLTEEDQLKAFCAVSRRIFQGEIEKKGSYRYVLYDVFGFGPEAYAQAQMAGYLAIHNAIVDANYDSRLLKAFCTKYKIENADEKITEFLI
jgi:hypothetical protein